MAQKRKITRFWKLLGLSPDPAVQSAGNIQQVPEEIFSTILAAGATTAGGTVKDWTGATTTVNEGRQAIGPISTFGTVAQPKAYCCIDRFTAEFSPALDADVDADDIAQMRNNLYLEASIGGRLVTVLLSNLICAPMTLSGTPAANAIIQKAGGNQRAREIFFPAVPGKGRLDIPFSKSGSFVLKSRLVFTAKAGIIQIRCPNAVWIDENTYNQYAGEVPVPGCGLEIGADEDMTPEEVERVERATLRQAVQLDASRLAGTDK